MRIDFLRGFSLEISERTIRCITRNIGHMGRLQLVSALGTALWVRRVMYEHKRAT